MVVKYFSWDRHKNDWLKTHRNVSFEVLVFHIENGGLLDILEHPNQMKHPGQRLFVIRIDDYIYLVPFDETEGEVILKTIIPSRKMTLKYLGR